MADVLFTFPSGPSRWDRLATTLGESIGGGLGRGAQGRYRLGGLEDMLPENPLTDPAYIASQELPPGTAQPFGRTVAQMGQAASTPVPGGGGTDPRRALLDALSSNPSLLADDAYYASMVQQMLPPEDPEAIRLLRAAGIDPTSREGHQALGFVPHDPELVRLMEEADRLESAGNAAGAEAVRLYVRAQSAAADPELAYQMSFARSRGERAGNPPAARAPTAAEMGIAALMRTENPTTGSPFTRDEATLIVSGLAPNPLAGMTDRFDTEFQQVSGMPGYVFMRGPNGQPVIMAAEGAPAGGMSADQREQRILDVIASGEINPFTEQPYTREDAAALVDGLITPRTLQDSTIVITDARSGRNVTLPIEFPPQAPLDSGDTAMPDSVDLPAATGGGGFTSNAINDIVDIFGGDVPYDESLAISTAMNDLATRTAATFRGNLIPGRENLYTDQLIQRMVVEPNSLWTGPAQAEATYAQTLATIRDEIGRREALIAGGGLPPTQIANYRQQISEYKGLARDHEAMLSAIAAGREAAGGMNPTTGAGGSVARPPAIPEETWNSWDAQTQAEAAADPVFQQQAAPAASGAEGQVDEIINQLPEADRGPLRTWLDGLNVDDARKLDLARQFLSWDQNRRDQFIGRN